MWLHFTPADAVAWMQASSEFKTAAIAALKDALFACAFQAADESEESCPEMEVDHVAVRWSLFAGIS